MTTIHRSCGRASMAAVLGLALFASPCARPADEQVQHPRVAPVDTPHVRVARLYGMHCAGCHGETGRGRGPASHFLVPRPRDFTTGDYKIRSSVSGDVPTDADLERTVRRGLPGTSMRPFQGELSEAEIRGLVTVLKGFSLRFDVDGAPKPVRIPRPPLATPGFVAAGRALYRKLDCAQCHGEHGRGDGPVAATLHDDRGLSIRPRDFSLPGMLKGGTRVEDIYRTLATGMDGTPMAALDFALSEEELWQLAYFVQTLSLQPVFPVPDRGRSRAPRQATL